MEEIWWQGVLDRRQTTNTRGERDHQPASRQSITCARLPPRDLSARRLFKPGLPSYFSHLSTCLLCFFLFFFMGGVGVMGLSTPGVTYNQWFPFTVSHCTVFAIAGHLIGNVIQLYLTQDSCNAPCCTEPF